MENGETEEIMDALLSSPEFANRANSMFSSGNSDQNFIEALYAVVLNRSASPAEIGNWVNGLPSIGRSEVANEFLTSAEFRSDAVRTFYGDPSLNPLPPQHLPERPLLPTAPYDHSPN